MSLDKMQPALRTLRILVRALLRPNPRRLGLLLAVLGGSLVLAPSAFANFFMPESGGSPNADNIHSLYEIVFYMGAIVFVIVGGVLIYCVWRFRASRNPVASQIHGNTRLEIGWTAGAALILVILAAVTFIKLPSIVDAPNSNAAAQTEIESASLTQPQPPNGNKLTICVTGRQFIWRYTYGAGCNKSAYFDKLPYTYQEMTVPAGVTVSLAIQSSDVIHSWWVPALGGKVDAVPGYTTYTWFKAEHAGALYRGQCAQLCGREHAFMTALVHVVTPAQYNAFIASTERLIRDQNAQVTQLRQDLEKQGSLTSNGIF